MATDKKKKVHYVNNKQFLEAIVERKRLLKEAEDSDGPPPQVSNYLGECILKIANHLSYRPNFINYTYKEDMISDGIENCLQYVSNFNSEKSNNPFAYFTQIIYYAFIRRIQKEKKQTIIKQKLILKSGIEETIVQSGDDTAYKNSYLDFLKKNMTMDLPLDKPKPKKKKEPRKLEFFM